METIKLTSKNTILTYIHKIADRLYIISLQNIRSKTRHIIIQFFYYAPI